MVEAENGKPQMEIKGIGEPFQPFKNITKLPKLKILTYVIDEGQVLYSYNFLAFNEVPVKLKIMTEENFEALSSFATPLGTPKTVLAFENGKVNVEEHPIHFGIDVKFKSLEKYNEVKKYALEFKLGSENYYLNLGGNYASSEMENSLAKNGYAKTYDYDLKGELANSSKCALLPCKPDLLRNVTAQIVAKRDFHHKH